ncbi:MAG: sterol desaturase family protein [Lewinellaceae bacterium]|nr:sterol desaturase family protein [Lewinellaceae bacterium]
MFNPLEYTTAQWLFGPVLIFGRYVLFCAAFFLVFYVWKRREWFFKKIQQRFPMPADYRREIGYSAIASIIFAIVTWLCLGTPLKHYTLFYTDIDQYGWAWLLFSIPLTLFVHDAYFYWIHRLMHRRIFYRRVHLIHHKSVNPSPWAAYAFHPVESVLEAGIIPLLLFGMPLHPLSFWAFITLMLLFNVYGHLGYELFPRSWYSHPLGRWLNTSVYHNLHHEKFTGNYGLYFTIWDRWCGTLRTDSEQKIENLHQRSAPPQADPIPAGNKQVA